MKLSSARFSTKVLVIFGVVIFLFAATIYFGRQVRVYLDMVRYTPERWWQESPRPLTDLSASPAPGKTLSYFGYKFDVPWTGVVREWTRDDARQAAILFDTGHVVLFWDPAYSQSDSSPGYSGSKYEHLKSVLSITRSGLSPFLSHQNFTRQRDRFDAKGWMLEHSGATDIFSFETHDYKGFEVSGLSYNGSVAIGLFDAADHQFLIEIQQVSGPLIKTSQQDVNRLIQSFGPAQQESWVEAPQPRGHFGLYR
jgi:hypothetical protein